MKIPGINYGGPVPSTLGAIQVVDDAQRRAAAQISQGLDALGQEMVRTQSEQAAVRLQTGLKELETEIASTPYMSAEQVRERLGPDFESLRPEVRQELTRTAPDGTTVDRQDVPTWMVAGALYQRRARELQTDAAQSISFPGHRSEFERKAQLEVADGQHRMVVTAAKAAIDDQKATQKATVAQLVRLKAYDQALEAVNTSKAWEPGEKAQLVESVLAQKQADEEIEVPLAAATEAAKARRPSGEVDVKRAQAILDGTGGLDAKQRLRAQAILDDKVRQAAQGYQQTLGDVILKAKAAWENGDPARGIAPYTDPNSSVPQELQGWLRNAQHPGGPDAWEQLLGWHQGYVNRDRANAQIPTPSQTAQAAELEADIVRETQAGGQLYRTMPVGVFVSQWAGRLTAPQFDRVFGLFLAANKSQPGGAVNLVSDKAVLMSVMPPEWLPAKRAGRGGPDPEKPETWPANSKPWAAWTDLSEAFDGWLRANPQADAKAKTAEAQRLVAERLAEQLRERSSKWGAPATITGFEARRRTDLDRSNYVPDESFEPPVVPGVPPADLPAYQKALRDRGMKATAANVLDLWKKAHPETR